MPAELFLIRHAEPIFPEGGRIYFGKEQDPPLSPAGRLQAEKAAARLADRGIARIYSSPARRCLETAAPLAESLGIGITVLDALRELDPGAWAGRSVASVRAEYGKAFEEGTCFPPPGGESDASGLLRAREALAVVTGEEGNAAIFGHAGLLRLMLSEMTGIPAGNRNAFDIRCASPLPVTVTGKGQFLPGPECFRRPENEK